MKAELNPVQITNSNGSVATFDYSKLKVIGDCALIEGADGTITLRIGPAVNSSLLNAKDGISDATCKTNDVSGAETATISASFASETHGSTTSVMKEAADYVNVQFGTTVTTATAAGHAVHFEDNQNGKFVIYIADGKNAANDAVAYETDIISASGTYKAASDSIECAISNWKEEPKTSSGANGYCANVNFKFYPSKLFSASTDFKVVKIEQVEGTSVVASWTTGSSVHFYMKQDTTVTPSTPTAASYTLTTSTKEISGVTYLTTSTKVNPTATGMANIAYPAYVSNKANVSPNSGNAWFSAYNETGTSVFTTWTDAKDATMNLTATAKTINKGAYIYILDCVLLRIDLYGYLGGRS